MNFLVNCTSEPHTWGLNKLLITEMSFYISHTAGVISKNFNKGGSRSNVIKCVWPICSYAHISKDGDIIMQSDSDII